MTCRASLKMWTQMTSASGPLWTCPSRPRLSLIPARAPRRRSRRCISFGSGSARIEVRVIAPRGAAAYLRALRADLAERKSAGTQLLGSPRIRLSAAARMQILAGHVDTRLMATIVTISGPARISVLAFGDPGLGAGAGSPLRSAELTPTGKTDRAGRSASVQEMIKFLNQQRPPFAPAWAAMVWLPGRQAVLRVEFAAPSPLGVLAGNGA